MEDEGDVAVGALGAADPGVHLGRRVPPVAHRAEALDDDDQVGRMHEVEERRALDRVGLVAGDPAEVVAPGEADAAVGIEDGDGEGMDDRRGSSRVARLRHVASRCRSRRPARCPQPGTTRRVCRSTRREYSPAGKPEVQAAYLGESDGVMGAPLVDCPVPQRSYDHGEW